MSLGIQEIAELAKQGGRLDSDRQWLLADALALLTKTQITSVSMASGRNESTLLQYARAAERWPTVDRVDGVSFSAHRVALSWHDPRQLLIDLKHQHGAPTVRQVREAMGLESHPAIELGEKMLKALDRKASAQSLSWIHEKLGEFIEDLDVQDIDWPETVTLPVTQEDLQPGYDRVINEDAMHEAGVFGPDMEDEAAVEVTRKGTWVPPVSTSDIAGI